MPGYDGRAKWGLKMMNKKTILLMGLVGTWCCMVSASTTIAGLSKPGKIEQARGSSARLLSKSVAKGSPYDDEEINVAGTLESARKIAGSRYLRKLLSAPISSDETEEQEAKGLPVSFLSIIARIETEDAAPPPFTDDTIPSMTTWSDDVSEAGIVPELVNSSPPGGTRRTPKQEEQFIHNPGGDVCPLDFGPGTVRQTLLVIPGGK